ncbi:hypothetical protein DEU56DRAFT_234799 [Suillus clintonianus]|uniref:uncharacterized protein n=1 Tax=Suillus clintonianus TaxID=1904413 RepID=UPI001B867AA3|nr:uncharacterized protein DEU56DRAFT_234799 [Suillus clintonianus]KAG2156425.1 hypothetical protein DEU56DRAFT_234799 [Suillus clintonianus]
MSEKSNIQEPLVQAIRVPSAETTESPLPIREAFPESACPETSTASPPLAVDMSPPVIKEALIPLPVSPASSSVTLKECKSGITEKQENGFLRRWQQWDWLQDCWKSYEYIEETPRVATREPNCFYLNVRRRTDKDKPKLVFSDFSPVLLACLRSIVGGECLSTHPQVPIDELLLELDVLDTRTNDARTALLEENNEDGVVQSAKALGHAHEGLHDGDARTYLTAAVQQLGTLLLLLKEEFKPVAERLKHAIVHGRIPRDLLEFYFRKDQKYYYCDDNDDFDAFRLTSTYYDDFDQTFTLNGEGAFWNGAKWTALERGRMVKLAEGSLILSDFRTTKVTPEICTRLTERGRKYASLAGVHHRLHRGRRIMVDRLGWNTFGYNHTDDTPFPFPLLRDRSKARDDDVLPVPEADIDLLPRFMPGFDLERKSWGLFDVDEVEPIKFNESAWKHIVLDESSKDAIEGVVGSFDFSKEATTDEEQTGLVILLHGPSGTGKTATVEAIAEHFRRPLYSLAVCSLPLDTTLLVDTLTSRLDAARTWNAIVLIEAGDILMQTQRLEPIMEEHIRISTTLEFFEQHRCLVFVTARTTCTAYMSHFAMTIQYPELDADSRQVMWSNMLSGEESNISRRDIEELSRVAVNGRAMKNIHKTAKALARSSKQPLSLCHLKTAAKTQGQVEGAGYHLYW